MGDDSGPTSIATNAMEPIEAIGMIEGSITGDGQSGFPEGETWPCADGGVTAAAQGRGAPGVQSSNTPPSTSIYNDNCEIWIGSEDWLEWVIYVEWQDWEERKVPTLHINSHAMS
jgi:hypothetical protein